MNLPKIILKFRKEGVSIELTEYFRKCTAD